MGNHRKPVRAVAAACSWASVVLWWMLGRYSSHGTPRFRSGCVNGQEATEKFRRPIPVRHQHGPSCCWSSTLHGGFGINRSNGRKSADCANFVQCRGICLTTIKVHCNIRCGQALAVLSILSPGPLCGVVVFDHHNPARAITRLS